MEDQEVKMPKRWNPESSFGFVVVLVTSVLLGGWLYVDIVRSDLQTQIDLLRMSQKKMIVKAGGNQVMGSDEMKQEGASTEIYSSDKYDFSVNIPPVCENNLRIEGPFEDPRYEAVYTVNVVTETYGEEGWRRYVVLTQEQYDTTDSRELPGKPRLIAVLKNGLLLGLEQLQGDPSGLLGKECEPTFESL